MRKIQRLAAIGVMAALTVSAGACSASQEPAAAPTTTASKSAAPTSESAATSNGVTQISDIAGPACSQVPTSGEGSAAGLVDDPVGTAAGNNPLLSTLVAALGAAKLGDTLNGAEAITVFAPINSAFEALEAKNPGIIGQLTTAPDVAEPTSTLSKVLTTHVVGTRYDAEGLSAAGTVPSLLAGSQLTIGGTAPGALTVTSGAVTAKVVCANVPTKNATVFLIDSVLPPAAG